MIDSFTFQQTMAARVAEMREQEEAAMPPPRKTPCGKLYRSSQTDAEDTMNNNLPPKPPTEPEIAEVITTLNRAGLSFMADRVRGLAMERDSLRGDRDERAVQKGEFFAEIERLREELRRANEARCPVCNAELSACGEMTSDGPTMDCKLCQLRHEIDRVREGVRYWSYCTSLGMRDSCPEKVSELADFLVSLGIAPYYVRNSACETVEVARESE